MTTTLDELTMSVVYAINLHSGRNINVNNDDAENTSILSTTPAKYPTVPVALSSTTTRTSAKAFITVMIMVIITNAKWRIIIQ